MAGYIRSRYQGTTTVAEVRSRLILDTDPSRSVVTSTDHNADALDGEARSHGVGIGVLSGLAVEIDAAGSLSVGPGMAVDRAGRLITLVAGGSFDVPPGGAVVAVGLVATLDALFIPALAAGDYELGVVYQENQGADVGTVAVLEQTPLFLLMTVLGLDAVALASVTVDTAGKPVALAAGRRTPTSLRGGEAIFSATQADASGRVEESSIAKVAGFAGGRLGIDVFAAGSVDVIARSVELREDRGKASPAVRLGTEGRAQTAGLIEVASEIGTSVVTISGGTASITVGMNRRPGQVVVRDTAGAAAVKIEGGPARVTIGREGRGGALSVLQASNRVLFGVDPATDNTVINEFLASDETTGRIRVAELCEIRDWYQLAKTALANAPRITKVTPTTVRPGDDIRIDVKHTDTLHVLAAFPGGAVFRLDGMTTAGTGGPSGSFSTQYTCGVPRDLPVYAAGPAYLWAVNQFGISAAVKLQFEPAFQTQYAYWIDGLQAHALPFERSGVAAPFAVLDPACRVVGTRHWKIGGGGTANLTWPGAGGRSLSQGYALDKQHVSPNDPAIIIELAVQTPLDYVLPPYGLSGWFATQWPWLP